MKGAIGNTLAAALVAFGVAACASRPGPPALDASACPAMCATLASLGCPEAQPSRRGEACVDLCSRSQRAGQEDLRPACAAAAKSTTDVRACGYRCLGVP